MTQQQLTPEAAANNFLSKTPRGTEFEFRANRTGSHNNDGTVFYNYEGTTHYLFKSIEDFVDYFFFDKDVEHEESAYVGTRTEDGSIDWIDKAYSDDELDLDDDGDGIYTKYQTVSA